MATSHADSGILFVNFNQDATSLAVGTKKGYTLYSLANIDELQKIHESNDVEETCLIERLFSSSLVTLVSLSAPRKLRVCHFQKGTEICSHSYTNAILSVRLNRLRVVVCLEESLYVHNIRDMKVLHTIRDTPPNTHGLCDLTAADVSYVAYPGSTNVGEVHIFDGANLQAVTIISAHDSPVAALKFNSDGTKLATASEKGTVIRVFDVQKGDKLFEFRRGVKRCVTIYSLAFSADSMYLCSSSNTETLHVFKLDAHNRHQGDHRNASDDEGSGASATAQATGVQGWMDYMSRTAANYLPTQMTDILHQDRSFATAKLPAVGARNVVAIASVKAKPRLFVASTDGYLYIYNVEAEGGECALAKQHRFTTSGQPSSAQERQSTSHTGGAAGKATDTRTYAEHEQLEHAVAGAGHPGESLRLEDSAEFPPMTHSTDD